MFLCGKVYAEKTYYQTHERHMISVADLGEGPGHLILGEKRKNQRRKNSQQGNQNKTGPSP